MKDYSAYLAYPDEQRTVLMNHARGFVGAQLSTHVFSEDETLVLRNFFTNLDSRVFYLHSLPGNVLATLMSMYSRMKNPRGLRGVFVDSFLPGILLGELILPDPIEGSADKFLQAKGITSLDLFLERLAEYGAREKFAEFVRRTGTDPEYLMRWADSARAKSFLSMWLDQYGHNSIARMGDVALCCERISILAAKSLEWSRPGAGYVELSTRYVDMQAAGLYPIAEELALLGGSVADIEGFLVSLFERYHMLEGEKLDGPVPAFFREQYAHLFEGNEKKLELGISGETFDLLGNLLPSATLTSVAIITSGESFPGLIKHLLLDGLPETIALAELIATEASKVGADQFVRHETPTAWDQMSWQYLGVEHFRVMAGQNSNTPVNWLSDLAVSSHGDVGVIQAAFHQTLHTADWEETLRAIGEVSRGDHDKLPSQFEHVYASFRGLLSFRSWRDLHRQGFSTHHRTLLTPHLGFYAYNKPIVSTWHDVVSEVTTEASTCYERLTTSALPAHLQYILPLGYRVGYHFGANLRQHEFCQWQRSKTAVNHEVREAFLGMDVRLCERYQWWAQVSRTNREVSFVFARGSEIPLYKK